VESNIRLSKNKRHHIEVVVDRLSVDASARARLADSLETALALGSGVVLVRSADGEEHLFSEKYACVRCGVSYQELTPRMFSFNSPYGACPSCGGLGSRMEIDPRLVIPDDGLSLNQGAVVPWGKPMGRWYDHQIQAVAKKYRFDLDAPLRTLSERARKVILYGSGEEEFHFRYQRPERRGLWEHYGGFEGLIPNLTRRYRQTKSAGVRSWVERFMSVRPCHECHGARLRPESLAVKVGDENIAGVTQKSVREALQFFEALKLPPRDLQVAGQILKEIRERLGFLINVGLDYLTLDRSAGTLAGGEAQRIRLATQIGSQLVGVLYILDEPSIGLHQRDHRRLLDT
jgi:excinuclease ABC subunit A